MEAGGLSTFPGASECDLRAHSFGKTEELFRDAESQARSLLIESEFALLLTRPPTSHRVIPIH